MYIQLHVHVRTCICVPATFFIAFCWLEASGSSVISDCFNSSDRYWEPLIRCKSKALVCYEMCSNSAAVLHVQVQCTCTYSIKFTVTIRAMER